MKQNNIALNDMRINQIVGQPVLSKGNNGFFRINLRNGYLLCIASDGQETGWEHVSVSRRFKRKGKTNSRIPTWDEMCIVKNLFWGEGEIVIQFHPAKKDYVNTHPHVLHLWRSLDYEQQMPPPELVGIKGVELRGRGNINGVAQFMLANNMGKYE